MKQLIFVHIPKTAGTTMGFVLARQYAGKPVYKLYEHDAPTRFRALPQAERDGYACIMGHMRFGIHRALSGQNFTYFTILRDPVQQIVSSYYFFVKQRGNWRYDQLKDLSFEEYLVGERAGEHQTRMLTDRQDFTVSTRINEPLPPEALDAAKHNLKTYFSVVGLMEEFDMTLLLLQRALGWRNIHYVQRNVNQARPKTVTPEMLALIEHHAQTDLALYAFAKTYFQEQVERFAPKIHDDLERFRTRNRLYSRVYGPTQGIRQSALYRTVRRKLRLVSS